MLEITHLTTGIVLARIIGLKTGTCMIASVLPDLDASFSFATPLLPGGVAHSVSACLLISLAGYTYSGDSDTAYSLFYSYLAHLLLDLFSISGIMVFFPLQKFYSLGIYSESGFLANTALISGSIAVIAVKRELSGSRPDLDRP